MIKRISAISDWLVSVTRQVLAPLTWSVLFRHLYFAAHLGLLTVGAWAIGSLARDLASGEPASWSLLWLVNALIGLSLTKAIFNYLEHFLGHLVAFKALEILRVELYRKLVPLATQIRSTSGDLMTRATKDIDRIEVFFAHTLAPAFTAVTVPLVALIVGLFTIGWQLVLIAAIGLLLDVLFVPWLGARRSLESARKLNASRAELAQHVTDSVQGMAEVTGYGHTRARIAEMGSVDERLGQVQRVRGRWDAIRQSAAIGLRLLTVLAVTIVGVSSGVDPVALCVWAVAVWGLYDVTAGIREFVGSLDASLAAAERVHQVATTPPKVTQIEAPVALPEFGLDIRVTGVDYIYPSERVRDNALTDVDLYVPAGSHTCLIGTSGSGKSTLLKLIARHDDPTNGKIRLAGEDLRDVALDDLRARVLLVEQTATIFNGTVAENLRLADEHAGDDALRQALEAVNLWEELEERGGLEAKVGEHGKLLSGGQRQRLALARAILVKPDVLLLDEFTAHLDAENAAAMRRNLQCELPGVTIIESTHTALGLEEADQIVILDNGRIHEKGTPAQVKESLKRLFGLRI